MKYSYKCWHFHIFNKKHISDAAGGGGGGGAAKQSSALQSAPTGHTFGGITTEFTEDVVKDGAGCRYKQTAQSFKTGKGEDNFDFDMGIFEAHRSCKFRRVLAFLKY